jgi:hypothetical protein
MGSLRWLWIRLCGLALCAVPLVSVYAPTQSFDHEHSVCTMMINMDAASTSGSPTATIADMKQAPGTRISCQEKSYMRYVRNALPTATGYKKAVLEAILNLYQDLYQARVPITMKLDEEGAHDVLIHPISFCIPEEFIAATVPPKAKAFGRVIPGVESTYYSIPQEIFYWQDMSRSMFAVTYKKVRKFMRF